MIHDIQQFVAFENENAPARNRRRDSDQPHVLLAIPANGLHHVVYDNVCLLSTLIHRVRLAPPTPPARAPDTRGLGGCRCGPRAGRPGQGRGGGAFFPRRCPRRPIACHHNCGCNFSAQPSNRRRAARPTRSPRPRRRSPRHITPSNRLASTSWHATARSAAASAGAGTRARQRKYSRRCMAFHW